MDESIQREEESLAQEEAFDPATADPASLQRQLRETRIRYEVIRSNVCKPDTNGGVSPR